MRRAATDLAGPVCFLVLLVVVYRPVLFEGGQFASANSSYFYPLYLRVQQEWAAGRWPLWDPGHNGGEPLLGNPMAAVLYPGKVLYAWLPYAWAVAPRGRKAYVAVQCVAGGLGAAGTVYFLWLFSTDAGRPFVAGHSFLWVGDVTECDRWLFWFFGPRWSAAGYR